MADECFSTTVTPDKEVAVISDSEGEDDDGIVENLDDLPLCVSTQSLSLPPEVWANVINYLPYDSLISCASTSKAILYDALPLVTTLHIEKSSQLRLGVVSNHLRDIRSVSIYNLFDINKRRAVINEDTNVTNQIQVDEDIATKSVQFITASKFSHLESVAYWGKYTSSLYSLNSMVLLYGENPAISHLLDKILGAFDSKSLPHNLQIDGLRCPRNRTSDSNCTICKRVCGKFPLKHIGDIDLCLPFGTSNVIIESREGGRDYLHSKTRLLQLLSNGRVKDPLKFDDFCIIKYDSMVRSELKSMFESSKVNFKKLNLDDVVKAIKRRYPNNVTVYLDEESFDHLKSIGLPISDDLLDPNLVRVENLELIVKHIMEETVSLLKSMHQMSCLLTKRDMLDFRGCLAQQMVGTGVLSKVVQFLSRKDDHGLQLAATEVLIMVSFVGDEHIEKIIKLGAIQPLVNLLGSSHSKISLRAASALGNIAGESFHFRDLALQAGAMQPLLKLLENHQTSDLESVRTYIWVLGNLLRFDIVRSFFRVYKVAKTPDFKLVSPALQILNELIQHKDEEVLVDVCWALGHFSHCSDSSTCLAIRKPATGVQAMIDIGIIPKLILLLNDYEQRDVCGAAVWAVATLLDKCSIGQIKYVVNQGCIPPLLDLLEEEDVDIVREALRALVDILHPRKGLSYSNILWRERVVISIVKARGYGRIKDLYHADENVQKYSAFIRRQIDVYSKGSYVMVISPCGRYYKHSLRDICSKYGRS